MMRLETLAAAALMTFFALGGAYFSQAGNTAAEERSRSPASLYWLDIALTDQHGETIPLDRYEGHPVMISMFYASCPHICPMLVSTVQRLESELGTAARKDLRVIMVTFDDMNDTPEKLQEVARRHDVDESRWTFARASSSDVRKLAAALGIQYRRLPDGNYNHSTIITLLAPDGTPLARTSNLGTLDDAFFTELKKATHAGNH